MYKHYKYPVLFLDFSTQTMHENGRAEPQKHIGKTVRFQTESKGALESKHDCTDNSCTDEDNNNSNEAASSMEMNITISSNNGKR